ncbi:MAG: S-methyl-5'-thioadenosine phosphorylase, partial [Chloroflexi bacterium]|nr:S-methyl-5'-thioadenosine phosphorylase [Chloroflexota bacterium]
VIGGSGLYQMEELQDVEERRVSTPFGDPSDATILGTLSGERVAFLPRHGRGHRLLPSEVPYRANIYALKSLGVERIISVSACGSLQEEIEPLHMVIPDQLFDRTQGRPSTFFGEGIVAHVSFDTPFCPDLSQWLYDSARSSGVKVHRGGTFVVMEGPQFSTKAESHFYRSLGGAIIGMTALPEAKLAREAEICYATLACVTDYDVWQEAEEPVTQEIVVRNLKQNVERAKVILQAIIPTIKRERPCICVQALAGAIATQKDLIPTETREKLRLLLGKFLE